MDIVEIGSSRLGRRNCVMIPPLNHRFSHLTQRSSDPPKPRARPCSFRWFAPVLADRACSPFKPSLARLLAAAAPPLPAVSQPRSFAASSQFRGFPRTSRHYRPPSPKLRVGGSFGTAAPGALLTSRRRRFGGAVLRHAGPQHSRVCASALRRRGELLPRRRLCGRQPWVSVSHRSRNKVRWTNLLLLPPKELRLRPVRVRRGIYHKLELL